MTGVPPTAYAHPGPAPERPERPEGAPARPRGLPPWRPWTGWAAIGAGFGAALFAGLIAAIVAAAAGASIEDPPPGVNIGLTFFQDFALIGAALLFARLAGRPRASDFGLRPAPIKPAVGYLLLVWAGFFAVTLAWVSALGIDQEDELPSELGADSSTVALVLVMVLVTVMAPIAEELAFRGYLFTALRNGTARIGRLRLGGLGFAAITSGAAFGAVHLGSSPVGFVVPLAFFGIGLCLLYHWTGSLYPCIALHALNNSLAFGVTQDWTWQIPIAMAASVCVSVWVAAALARRLGGGPSARAA